jgi:adenylate kinase family enzyme
MHTSKIQSYIFIGRSGCGKGTQATRLLEALKAKYPSQDIITVETGKEFRNYIQGTSYTAQVTKKVYDTGGLMPEFMCVYMWGRLLAEHFTGNENLIFDGTPRKIMEAKMLLTIFPYYNISKPWVIHLDVNHEETIKRLKLRGRGDDGDDAMNKRLAWYESDVKPCVEYYRTSHDVNFIEIDGNRNIDEVHKDIVKKVGLV